jgi:hypothetical protein
MNETRRSIRLRSVLDRYFVAVLIAVVLVGVVGGYLTYTAYGTTATTTETRQETSWESTGTFTHNAVVVNDTAVYDEGDVLRNRSTYFRELTPRLNGSFLYRYTASDGGNLTADITTSLVLRSAEQRDSGQSVEYWRLDSELSTQTVRGLAPGERLRVPYAVNVTAASQRLERVDRQFGTTPGEKTARIRTTLTLSGTRNGEPVTETRTYALPLSVSNSLYSVQSDGPTTNSGGQTTTVEVATTPGPLSAYGGPLTLLAALIAGGGLVAGRTTGAFGVSAQERDWLAYRNARAEFDDWITVATVPASVRRDPDIAVESLEGLVDIAIDTDERVLEARDSDIFVVLDGDRTYAYRPPSAAPQERELLAGDDGHGSTLGDGLAWLNSSDGADDADTDESTPETET